MYNSRVNRALMHLHLSPAEQRCFCLQHVTREWHICYKSAWELCWVMHDKHLATCI